MAHHMARVCKFADSLFISDADSAADLALLQEHGITHVVSALPMEPVHKKECKYLIVPVVDSEIEDLIPHFPTTVQFISNALKDGGKVLIHCAAGISRSSSICINFLMATRGISYEEAFTTVKKARPIVCPNPGFREQLRLFAEMKFTLEGDSLAHRHYRIRKIWSMVHQGSARSAKLEKLLAADPAFTAVATGTVYACSDCGRRLFAESNVMALHEGRTCAADSLTIDAMSWMKPATLPSGNDAPLQCPGCNAHIGKVHFKMNWRCVCSLDWSPAIRVRRNKVKLVAGGGGGGGGADVESAKKEPEAVAKTPDLELREAEENGLLLKTDACIVVAESLKSTLRLPKDAQVCRVPGRFSAFDFIKVFPANSSEGRSGLYLCGAGPLTDESTIKELLTQGALGCTRVAIVHDLFDRSGPLQSVLLKSGADFYVKLGILGVTNPKRRLVAEWSKAGDKLCMRKTSVELGQYLRGLGFSILEVESLDPIKKELSLRPPASKQSTNSVLMVVPVGFAHNAETAADNSFMHQLKVEQSEVERKAIEDFNRLHAALTAAEVKVTLFVNSLALNAPDAVFPNNWFSTHPDGKRGAFVLYPMKAPTRRNERRADIINFLRSQYAREVSLTEWETHAQPAILEGTGSMVLDRIRRVCFLALSPRSDAGLAKRWAELMEYTVVPFTAFDAEKKVVYHTNVVMAIGTSFAVICTESVAEEDRARVLAKLKEHHEVIEITLSQMNNFCGNILELTVPNARVAVMSTRAFNAFTEEQRFRLSVHVDSLIHADISTIENIGGGGVRCMLAELF